MRTLEILCRRFFPGIIEIYVLLVITWGGSLCVMFTIIFHFDYKEITQYINRSSAFPFRLKFGMFTTGLRPHKCATFLTSNFLSIPPISFCSYFHLLSILFYLPSNFWKNELPSALLPLLRGQAADGIHSV